MVIGAAPASVVATTLLLPAFSESTVPDSAAGITASLIFTAE
jgi:hypothetical protein